MHSLLSVYVTLLAASTSSKPKASATSSFGSLLFILLLGVLAYVFFIRPRSQQARRQRETLQEVAVGDEILTASGIFGRVLDVEADRITIETAPGTRLTVLKSTIARNLTDHSEDEADPDEQDAGGVTTSGPRDSGRELTGGGGDGGARGGWRGRDGSGPSEERDGNGVQHDAEEGEEDTGGTAAGGRTGTR